LTTARSASSFPYLPREASQYVQDGRSATERVGLPAELSEVLLELGLAVQRCGLYPGGHPSVDVAVKSLTRRMAHLMVQREMLSLGVARRQLVVEGVATEAAHPVLRSLAERLHRHRVGAVVFRRGVQPAELVEALHAVAEDPDRTGEPLGLMPLERFAGWPHVRFHALTYEQLQLALEEGDEGEEEDEGEAQEGEREALGRGATATQLWLGLARAALAKGEAWAERDVADADPAEVARAINEHPAASAYDQVIVGFMLQLAEELKKDGGKVAMVRRRVSQVVNRLDPETVERLLEMGGDVPQRARFLHGAVRGLRPDAVLELLRAAARTEGQSISTSMLRMLRKLSAVAVVRRGPASKEADTQVRDQMHELLVNWSLFDPNPGEYTQVLERVSRTGVEDDPSTTAEHAAEPDRIVKMGLEMGTSGVPFLRSVETLLTAGRLSELYELLGAIQQPNAAQDAVWEQILKSDQVRRLLTTDPVDFETLDPALQRLPASTVILLLLDRLSESTSRATRMGAFRRLTARGLPVTPFVVERLYEERWYVLRNMLALLNEIGSWPEGFSALQYARHQQATVRREALQLATRIRTEREQAIELALADADERAMRIGVNAARDTGLPSRAVPTALERLADPNVSTDVVVALVRLLAQHNQPAVVELLLSLVVTGRRTFFRRPKLAPRSPEMMAALTSLAALGSDDGRVHDALGLARKSPDPAVRAAVEAQSA
jgi:hypothetical protein